MAENPVQTKSLESLLRNEERKNYAYKHNEYKEFAREKVAHPRERDADKLCCFSLHNLEYVFGSLLGPLFRCNRYSFFVSSAYWNQEAITHSSFFFAS